MCRPQLDKERLLGYARQLNRRELN
jgi:hypothetical protein